MWPQPGTTTGAARAGDDDVAAGPGPEPPASGRVLIDHRVSQGRRARAAERLESLFEAQCDRLVRFGGADHPAVDSADGVLSYPDLDAAANRLARVLRLHHAGSGHRVALLLDRPADLCTAMLAVAKIGATYVPLDVRLAPEQVRAVVDDAGATLVLTTSSIAGDFPGLDSRAGTAVLALDLAARTVAEQSPRRLPAVEHGAPGAVAYIVYLVDDDGRPCGVAIDHGAVCNVARVTVEMYGIGPRDRVYQGQSPASDLLVEQTWVPWVAGATVVAPPDAAALDDAALGGFLRERGVTVLRSDPATLAVLDERHLPVRLVLSAASCPADVIERWHRPGRRLIGTYGAPEATVITTWTELDPGRPSSLGVPLPTAGIVVLDLGDPSTVLPRGETGEIGIVGAGLARGYLGRDDLEQEAFVPAPPGLPANPSNRIFRTGDLGRITPDGSVEYRGRIQDGATSAAPTTVIPVPDDGAGRQAQDVLEERFTEVLAEVLGLDGVPAQANVFELGADSLTMAKFCARVRTDPALPTLSIPQIYRHPTLAGLAAAVAPAPDRSAPTTTGLLERLRTVLAAVVEQEVADEAHFFDDLGADSLTMAKFCARLRTDPALPTPAIQDLYAHPTLALLASALAPTGPPTTGGPPEEPAVVVERRGPPVRRVGTAGYVLCGLLQVGFVLGWTYLMALPLFWGYEWMVVSATLLELYDRAVIVGAGVFVFLCLFPIVVKWLLIGRWTPRSIRVWSIGYVRFWIVRTIVGLSPLVLFRGSPLYLFHLRALGARIGRDSVVFTRSVPVCTDLLSIGERSVVRKDAMLTGYRARDGLIDIGPVTLGDDVFVGEATILDLDTRIGDGGQLGHSSALLSGQAVPAGERWHGSPARPAAADYCTVPPARCGRARKILYSMWQLALLLGIGAPLSFGGLTLLLREVPQLRALLFPGPLAFVHWYFYAEIAGLALVLIAGFLLLAFVLIATVPRLLARAVRPGRVHPLYGVHYFLHGTVAAMTNNAAFIRLFGDSSAIPHYLRAVGYDLTPLVQTGNNFGLGVKHENPYLAAVGSGTVVADELSIVNAEFSHTSFRVTPARIGERNFLGNRITYPSQGRTGDNCLLGTKVMVPVDGPVRADTGLLGSPSFEIPRTVARDTRLAFGSDALHRALRGKNRHNLLTMLLHLGVRWLYLSGVMMLIPAMAVFEVTLGALEIAIVQVLIIVFTVLWFALVDKAVRPLQLRVPSGCSIYEPEFWGHERFWKVPAPAHMALFNGTPLKGPVYRLNGVRVGARLYDGGCVIVERSFVSLGDDCMLNERSIIQSHSQEDSVFKSDDIVIGSRVSVGTGAFVFYGITVGDDAAIEADSFVMKGEEVPEGATWGGNPARDLPVRSVPAPA